MDVDVLEMKIVPDKTKIAELKIRYHEMEMYCDLVLYTKRDKVWVRMPEIWRNRDIKTCFCRWPTREISDEFQKEVLKKIFDKYDLDLDKVKEIHLSRCREN